MTRFRRIAYLALMAFILTDCKYKTAEDTGNGGIPDSCMSFLACGGDPTGTLHVSDICLKGDLNAEMFSETNLPTDCSNLFQNAVISASGSLTYANNTETLNWVTKITVTAQYTDSCLSAVLGQPSTMDSTICNDLQTQWSNRVNIDSAVCSLIGTTCSCAISESISVNNTNGYTVDIDTLNYTNGSHSDFCVSGATLSILKPGLYGTLSGVISANQ
jgi:hypothetical protein